MARRASSRAISLVALAATAVLTAIVVATVATSSLLGVSHPHPDHISRHTHAPPIHRTTLAAPVIPGWLESSLLVLLMVAIAALIVFAKGRRRPPDERLQYEEEPDSWGDDWDALISVDLGEAAAEQLRRLHDGTPRNAIVACWMSLQGATARAGTPPIPAETSTEFTVRAMRRLALDEPAITTLSELYREARFSDHEIGEPGRRRALAAVGVLSGQLNMRSAVPVSGPAKGVTLDIVSP